MDHTIEQELGASLTSSSAVEALADVLREWDTDRGGSVDKDEFFAAVKQLGYEVPRKAADRLFRKLDLQKTGAIEVGELSEALRPYMYVPKLKLAGTGTRLPGELAEGAKDFGAYYNLRHKEKGDALKAFESSCYGQAVDKQMAAVLKNKGKPGKDKLVLAELQALQKLPY